MNALRSPKKVAILAHTTPSTVDYVVAAPVKPGLQPCLLITNLSGAKRQRRIRDALVVLPADAKPRTTFPDAELGGYLALATAAYRKELAKPALKRDAANLAKIGRQYSPFSTSSRSKSTNRQWKPRRVKQGAMMRRSWREHRMIIAHWSDWDFRGRTWAERFTEHCENMGRNVFSDPHTFRKARRNFRAKCRYLGFGKQYESAIDTW